MIIIQPLNGEPAEHFETFDQLFEFIMTIEALKLVAKNSHSKPMNWNFTVYSADQVFPLLAGYKKPPGALEEAYEENLSLIEICTGDYKKPLYVVLTPNVDMDYLKKKWCVDYCTYHDLVVRERL
ncbi:MAG: hypothetical protein ACOH2E_03315 [Candidatus Paracaedibacter sp.]